MDLLLQDLKDLLEVKDLKEHQVWLGLLELKDLQVVKDLKELI